MVSLGRYWLDQKSKEMFGSMPDQGYVKKLKQDWEKDKNNKANSAGKWQKWKKGSMCTRGICKEAEEENTL